MISGVLILPVIILVGICIIPTIESISESLFKTDSTSNSALKNFGIESIAGNAGGIILDGNV